MGWDEMYGNVGDDSRAEMGMSLSNLSPLLSTLGLLGSVLNSWTKGVKKINSF